MLLSTWSFEFTFLSRTCINIVSAKLINCFSLNYKRFSLQKHIVFTFFPLQKEQTYYKHAIERQRPKPLRNQGKQVLCHRQAILRYETCWLVQTLFSNEVYLVERPQVPHRAWGIRCWRRFHYPVDKHSPAVPTQRVQVPIHVQDHLFNPLWYPTILFRNHPTKANQHGEQQHAPRICCGDSKGNGT